MIGACTPALAWMQVIAAWLLLGLCTGGCSGHTCEYQGKHYAPGQVTPGCPGCTCQADGRVVCPTIKCVGADGAGTGAAFGNAGPVPTQATETTKTALQYSGAIVYERSAKLKAPTAVAFLVFAGALATTMRGGAASDGGTSDASTGPGGADGEDGGKSGVGKGGERWELSAPIFPKVLDLYAHEGAAFPTTLADEQSLASGAALDFDALLTECAQHYPGIRVWVTGTPELTRDELETNYDLVAQCAYDRYTAKPYWIPQLVDDVDLCASKLGSDWHLVSESDLASLDETAYNLFAVTLASAQGRSSSMGSLYFLLAVYLRANDGTLKLGNLNPGVASRVIDLPVSGDATRVHLEDSVFGTVVVRCLRHSTVK